MTPPRRQQTAGEEIREEILDAALRRFQTYGLGKTTMAEIAEDTGMSAANLYRYFESKHDIAGACACRCMDEGLARLREVMQQPAGSAAERLETFVLTLLRHVHERTNNNPNIHELVDVVSSRRRELVREKMASEQSLLAEILAQGNHSGEFDVADVIGTARAVHTALMMFTTPFLMHLDTLEHFEQRAREVVALLLRGLSKRD